MSMKKNPNSESNNVLAFWQKTLLDAKVITLAKKFRKEFGVPINGFESFEEFEKWRLNNVEKNENDQRRIDNFNEFVQEAEKFVSHKGIVTDVHFRLMLADFFYCGTVEMKTLEKAKYSEFKVEIFDDGVYIKIGPYSPIDQIKKYILSNSSLIKSAQKGYRLRENLSSQKKFKLYKNFNRDRDISIVNGFGTKELRESGAVGTYKHDLIANLMKKIGYKGVLNGEIVKIALQRRRKMTKALTQ